MHVWLFIRINLFTSIIKGFLNSSLISPEPFRLTDSSRHPWVKPALIGWPKNKGEQLLPKQLRRGSKRNVPVEICGKEPKFY